MTLIWKMAAFLTAGIILYLSLQPFAGTSSLTHIDKVQHFGAYTVLCGFIGLGWPGLRLWKAVVIAGLFGVGVEVAQGLTAQGRQPSVLDALANLAGAVFAAFMVRFIRR